MYKLKVVWLCEDVSLAERTVSNLFFLCLGGYNSFFDVTLSAVTLL